MIPEIFSLHLLTDVMDSKKVHKRKKSRAAARFVHIVCVQLSPRSPTSP
jgi:hypothetical protein